MLNLNKASTTVFKNCPQFTSRVFGAFSTELNVKPLRTTGYRFYTYKQVRQFTPTIMLRVNYCVGQHHRVLNNLFLPLKYPWNTEIHCVEILPFFSFLLTVQPPGTASSTVRRASLEVKNIDSAIAPRICLNQQAVKVKARA